MSVLTTADMFYTAGALAKRRCPSSPKRDGGGFHSCGLPYS